jgi:hypothetical protein
VATKPDPKALFIAVMSFQHEPFEIKEGDRVRGDHPEVQRVPHLFLADGATTEELAKARQKLVADALARTDLA